MRESVSCTEVNASVGRELPVHADGSVQSLHGFVQSPALAAGLLVFSGQGGGADAANSLDIWTSVTEESLQ